MDVEDALKAWETRSRKHMHDRGNISSEHQGDSGSLSDRTDEKNVPVPSLDKNAHNSDGMENASFIAKRIDRIVARQGQWLDSVALECQRCMNVMLQVGGKRTRLWMRFLNGDAWLGHPLHPALTDVPIGAWVTAMGLDLVGMRRGADAAVALGLAAVMPTMLAGCADYLRTEGHARRVAFIHMLSSCLGTHMYMLSLGARVVGKRRMGILLSTFGLAIISGTGYLGGELVFRYGIGVQREVPQSEAN